MAFLLAATASGPAAPSSPPTAMEITNDRDEISHVANSSSSLERPSVSASSAICIRRSAAKRIARGYSRESISSSE